MDIQKYVKPEILEAIDDYHYKSLAMQEYLYDRNSSCNSLGELQEYVDDDLIFNVPIYDMLDRKYAAFSSFLEALHRKEADPKGNGDYFIDSPSLMDLEIFDCIALFYLFRLCGSGINYKPLGSGAPFGTHGFGNFWIVDSIRQGSVTLDDWLFDLEVIKRPFTDNKGYLLPQMSYPGLTSGHLKHFILTETESLIEELYARVMGRRLGITTVVDIMNEYLMKKGYKRQTFVLSATAADIAEYFPDLVDPNSEIYAGTNAKKCISMMFDKPRGISREDFEIEAIMFLADRYKAAPYSVEDSRLCDVYRYLKEYQSPHHIALNKGIVYKNNSVLKFLYGDNYTEEINKMLP